MLRLHQGIPGNGPLHVRQPALPLSLGPGCRFLRHCSGLPGGRGQDPLYELACWQVSGSAGLRRPHVRRRTNIRFLQRVRTVFRPIGLLEHLHVRHLRTVKTSIGRRGREKKRAGFGTLLDIIYILIDQIGNPSV